MARTTALFSLVVVVQCVLLASAKQPNIVVLFADDFGWGDVGCNNPASETPHIDRLAQSGIRFTDMHAGASVCTPSRAALMTGRYGARTGVVKNFAADAAFGLPLGEHTIASLLKPQGYDTAMLGKWHLGAMPPYHPSFRGFDEYFGLPYSPDMGCTDVHGYDKPMLRPCPRDHISPSLPLPLDADATFAHDPEAWIWPALPLFNSTTNCSHKSCDSNVIEQPANIITLSHRYGARARDYILQHDRASNSKPFFLYVAFMHTHVPLAHLPHWTNSSKAKTVFADTVMELDDTVRMIYQALGEAGILDNTLILATADNGPWRVKCEYAGSQGPFVGAYQEKLGGGSTGKFTTWEGGHRVFGIASWAGKIKPGRTSNALVSTLDFLPTILNLAGAKLPDDRVFDGHDLAPVLFDGQSEVRDVLFHPDQWGNLTAMRYNNYKVFFMSYSEPGCDGRKGPMTPHNPPLIFDLTRDPGESTPISNPPPQLLADVVKAKADIEASIASTYHNVANFSGGRADWVCCNPQHVLCRCKN